MGEWYRGAESCGMVLTQTEVRGDLFVGVYTLGLTLVALVVVEIWGEISPHLEI